MEEMTNKEGMGTKFIKDFCDHLRKGTSVLQKTSKNPNYIVNAETGHPYLGYNMIVANQGMFDAGLKSHLVLSYNQMEDHKNEKGFADPYYARKGTKSIGTAFTKNPDAFYTDKSPEVVDGKAKAGDIKLKKNGEPYKDLTPWFLYAVPNLQKTELAFRVKDGKKQTYAENQYSDTETYSKDKTITNPITKETIEVKKGDPKIIHFAGSKIATRIGNNKPLDYKEPEMVPLITNEMAPLYTRKNDSAKEVLMENLTKFFRGCMNGNFEGCRFSSSEIDNIEKEFANHSRQFMGICNSAYSRASKTPDVIARMDEAVAKKENQNTQTNTNTEVKTNTKGKGRS